MKRIAIGIVTVVVLIGLVIGLKILNDRKQTRAAQQGLLLGDTMIEKKDLENAEKAFLSLLQSKPGPEYANEALQRLAVISEQQDKPEAALDYWRRLVEEHPESKYYPEALFRAGTLAVKTGNKELAGQYFAKAEQSNQPQWQLMAQCGRGSLLEQQEEYEQALALYKEVFAKAKGQYPDAEKLAKERLGDLNVMLMFSQITTPGTVLHKVVQGESVTSIGSKYNTSKAVVSRANSLRNEAIRLGQTLKIKPGNFNIVINKKNFTLTLYSNGEFFKEYPVGLGRKTHDTAAGKYIIRDKMVDPVWYKPSGEVVPAGDPANELGRRWMGLEPQDDSLPSDLGIHGTIDPGSIGWGSSSGCPRMLPQDAEELFDLMIIKIPVEIVQE